MGRERCSFYSPSSLLYPNGEAKIFAFHRPFLAKRIVFHTRSASFYPLMAGRKGKQRAPPRLIFEVPFWHLKDEAFFQVASQTLQKPIPVPINPE
jgi:hypothetical protein